ncbi:MAG: PhzF family phenazine biosynthesis protein [Ignavibacterium sp.]|nr:MAG: PhzF family phenazine biosynthesis protein [Ignavibacterium sp.]
MEFENPIQLHLIDAFTSEAFGGNSAVIIHQDDLPINLMQLIAKEMNLPETAFLFSSDKADYSLKWFTPTIEVELCGHATIASLHYLSEQGFISKNSAVTFDTLSGVLDCRVDDDKYFMKLPVPKFRKYEADIQDVIEAIGLKASDLDTNFPPILQNNGNLFIYSKSLDSIKNLKPNFSELLKLSNQNRGFTEFTVFSTETVDEENDAHLRFFAPFYGINEDPVTGSVNGPLLLVLRMLGIIDADTENKQFTFEQGDSIGRKGRVTVTYSPDKDELMIAGNAVTVMRGELFL